MQVYGQMMDRSPQLRGNRHWRTAVVALRVGYAALAVVAIGLVLVATGSTPWVLAIGMAIWLVAAIITALELMRGRYDLPEPRPGFWAIRLMLLRESTTFHPGGTH